MINRALLLLLLHLSLGICLGDISSEMNATSLCLGFMSYITAYKSGSMLSESEMNRLFQETGFDYNDLDLKENTSSLSHSLSLELLRKGSDCHNNRNGTNKGRNHILECMIVKDQAHYISEHLAYHFVQGVDHFVIYDGNSTDNLSDVLEPWISSGTVTLLPQTTNSQNVHHFQGYHYRRCFEHYAKEKNYTWVTFLDVDEFVNPLQELCLSDLLDSYTEFGGLSIPWLVFKDVFRMKVANPKEFRIETVGYNRGYTAPFVKPFCQTKKVRKTHRSVPHFCEFLEGSYPVNENFTKLHHKAKPNNLDVPVKVQIAHYQFLSIQESLLKLKRDDHAGWSGDTKDLMRTCMERLTPSYYNNNQDPISNADYIRQFVVNPAKALLGISTN